MSRCGCRRARLRKSAMTSPSLTQHAAPHRHAPRRQKEPVRLQRPRGLRDAAALSAWLSKEEQNFERGGLEVGGRGVLATKSSANEAQRTGSFAARRSALAVAAATWSWCPELETRLPAGSLGLPNVSRRG